MSARGRSCWRRSAGTPRPDRPGGARAAMKRSRDSSPSAGTAGRAVPCREIEESARNHRVEGGAELIALLQRVTSASVTVDARVIAGIERGLLVFVGVEREDDAGRADRLLERVLGYRVFPDAEGRMNRSLIDIQGGLLLVPQFTLSADTRKGMRPSFSSAAAPERGEHLFDHLASRAKTVHAPVETGRFGADMQVASINDGPVTFVLRTAAGGPPGSAA